MELKFIRVVLLVVVIGMMAMLFIACNSNNGNDDIVMDVTETAEEAVVVEATEPTKVEVEKFTEPTKAVEEDIDEIVDDEEDDKTDDNDNYSNSSNNTYNENVNVTEPTYDYEQEEESESNASDDIVTEEVPEEIPEETIVSETEAETEVEVEAETDNAENSNANDGSNETEDNLISMGNFKLTAYCACSRCCGKSDGITATGTIATQGRTIAVDPNVIPYGTEVVINGNTYIAEDCGGAIKYNKIDIFFDSHQEALNFGVQYADVYIKEE